MLYCILWHFNVIKSLIRFVKFKKNLNVNISSEAIEDNLKSPYKLFFGKNIH